MKGAAKSSSWKARFPKIAGILIAASVLTGIILFAGNDFAQNGNPATNQTQIEQFFSNVDDADCRDADRDCTGNIVKVQLAIWTNNYARLKLVSQIPTLRELTFVNGPFPKMLSRAEIALLASATNLQCISLRCFGTINGEAFDELCKLPQVKEFHLIAVRPPVASYSSLTNLQSVTTLEISYCRDFGDRELGLLARLPNLTGLKICETAVTREGTNVLKRMDNLSYATIVLKKID